MSGLRQVDPDRKAQLIGTFNRRGLTSLQRLGAAVGAVLFTTGLLIRVFTSLQTTRGVAEFLVTSSDCCLAIGIVCLILFSLLLVGSNPDRAP